MLHTHPSSAVRWSSWSRRDARPTNWPANLSLRRKRSAPAGFYAWKKRPRSARDQADVGLLRRIRTIHAISQGTYGAPRIQAELQAEGLRVGEKRVARLMQEAGLAGV